MAEGGYDDLTTDDFDEYFPDPDEDFQESILNRSDTISTVDSSQKQELLLEQKKSFMKEFYKEVQQKYNINPEYQDTSNFEISDDAKTLYWVVGDKKIQLTKTLSGKTRFISLKTIANRYGPGAANAIREYLNLPDYSAGRKLPQLPQQAIQALHLWIL